MSSYRIVGVEDLLAGGGESAVRDAIGDFSCKYNPEIDGYLRDCAVDFTRKSMTITHLVFDAATSLCVGYFALAHKPVAFRAEGLSATQRKRMERFAKPDKDNGFYKFGTRDSIENGKPITYDQLFLFLK